MIPWLALLGSALAGEAPLVPRGGTWRYLDTGVDPGPSWRDPAFDDTAWRQGAAPLGYGLANLATVVSFGPNPQARYPTTWFRTSFAAADLGSFEAFSLHLRRDDGAAVYLNGAEVFRTNLAANATAGSYALSGVYGAAQDAFLDVVIPRAALRDGTNVVAVEVHNQSANSVDLVMDLGLSAWDGPTAVTRGPYLQQPAPDGVVVRWRTDGPGTGEVRWGSAPGALTESRTDPVVGFDHEVRIDGWTPDTDLAYSVGHAEAGILAGDDPRHVLHTPPLPGARVPLRFWVLGDSGTADANAEAVRDAYAAFAPDPLDTQVWMMLGDNAYGSGTVQEYDEAVFAMYPDWLRQVPLWATLGNHDGYSAYSDTQTGPYFDLFSWPSAGESGGEPSGTEAYWSFDHGNVHVIDLDSYHSDRSPDGPMATWLRADLAATQADWILAFFHHPPYTRGSHDSDWEEELVEMREHLLPILEDGGVDLVMTGHSHSYERSYLLDGAYGFSDELQPEQVLQDHDGDPAGDGAYRKWFAGVMPHEGAVQVVAGSSGMTSGGPLDHPVMHVGLDVLGSLVLDVDGMELTGRFLDDAGVVRDTFAIHKGVTTFVEVTGDTLGTSGELLQFSALALHPDGSEVTEYLWEWGDGSPPTSGAAAEHAFVGEGTWTVTVTATDDAGRQLTDTLDVAIDAGPPVIEAIVPSPGPTEGSPFTLTAVASDPANDPLTYAWDLEGYEDTGVVGTFTVYDDGPWLARLVVTDDAGREAEETLQVEVANAAPRILSVTDGEPVEGAPTTLSASVSDPGFDPLVVTWDFGGGDTATGRQVSHTFPQSGRIPVRLTVRDDGGGETVEELLVQVANADPEVVEASVEGEPVEGEPLTFRASATDPGTLDPLTLTWDFGDGSPLQVGEEVRHAFPDQGPYQVRVTVEDGEGGLGGAELEVALTNAPPRIRTVLAPTAVDEGVPQLFRVTAEDPGLGDELVATWSFGDGSVEVGTEVTHAFQDDGGYLVGLTVTDDEGSGESQLFSVEVRNVAPAFASEPSRTLVEPGGRFQYQVEVRDVDPVDLRLRQPADATLVGDSVVWRASRGAVRVVPFELVADDGDGGVTTQAFVVAVAGTDASPPDRFDHDDLPPCGCRSGGDGPTGQLAGLGLVAVVLAGRRPLRPRRR